MSSIKYILAIYIVVIKKVNKTLLVILLFLCAYIFYEINFKNEDKVVMVNVSDFNALADDDIDDTVPIQKSIDYASKHKIKKVYFPTGSYIVSTINLKSNLEVNFNNVILKVIPNKYPGYKVINIQDVHNVSIKGNLLIEGERYFHKSTDGEWGMGISILGSTKILVEDVVVTKSWGDGIYISGSQKKFSENITLINLKLINNRRQGISIVSGKNIKILNPYIFNTRGTPPAFGIDIEPNSNKDSIENITIENPYIKNNEGGGLLIYTGNYTKNSKKITIKVKNTDRMKDQIVVKQNKNVNISFTIEN